MTKLINFIALLIFSSLFALTPIYATSHEAKEKEAATEEATPKAGDTSASEDGEKKKKADEEEEPDCD